MVSSSATISDKNDSSSEEEDTTKIKRGRTLLAKVMRQKDKGQKFKLQWNGKGQTIQTNNANFKSYMGICSRSRVSILYRSWHKVPDHIKESIWTDVSVKSSSYFFNLKNMMFIYWLLILCHLGVTCRVFMMSLRTRKNGL